MAGPELAAPGRRRKAGRASGSAAPPLRVLDPACGSGSFLIGAYQFLLDWYRDRYLEDGPEKWARGATPRLLQAAGGEWRLTTAERKRILLAHIYGVDIDPQAVEVTKLSLLLKVLEGESDESLSSQMRLFQERALPDLSTNIQCGNSLIGPDFYDGQQLTLLDDEERYRINVFDWEAAFPEVFSGDNPGFDAVIGNPPDIFGEFHAEQWKQYLESHFVVARNQYDTYWLFIERCLALCAKRGVVSLIVPDALLARDEPAAVRKLVLDHGLVTLYHCGPVFEKVGVSAVVFVANKADEEGKVTVFTRDGVTPVLVGYRRASDFRNDAFRFTIYAGGSDAGILDNLEAQSLPLETYVRISRGEELGKKNVRDSGRIPIVVGEDISRYCLASPTRFIEKAAKVQSNYDAPKIMMVKTGSRVVATLDQDGVVTMQSVYNIHLKPSCPYDIRYILGMMGSKLLSFFANRRFTSYKKVFPQFNQSNVLSFPIRTIDFEAPDDRKRHERMVALVERMLELHRRLPEAATAHEKTLLQREIDATDRQIDRLVYDLYGLTEEEIRIVEAATRG